jgi:hypothetical protein
MSSPSIMAAKRGTMYIGGWPHPNYALYRTGHDKVASPWLLCPVDKRER